VKRAGAALGSLLWLLIAPGVVSGLVPWWITGWESNGESALWLPIRVIGAALVVVSVIVLLHAFARFAIDGLGTPAPVAPTERLVVTGLYRHLRNPMYVAVVSIIVGQALLLLQPILLPYAALIAAVSLAFVKGYEEPTLRRQFGADYDAYRAAVPGWWPRWTAWQRDDGGPPRSSP
jgi:protein-S-isoprenylcysteine O-methyltransferase Ste14